MRLWGKVTDLSDGSSGKDDNKPEEKSWKSSLFDILPSDESFENVCGFRLSDLSTYDKFVALMYRPTDPASLGVARALFGEFL